MRNCALPIKAWQKDANVLFLGVAVGAVAAPLERPRGPVRFGREPAGGVFDAAPTAGELGTNSRKNWTLALNSGSVGGLPNAHVKAYKI